MSGAGERRRAGPAHFADSEQAFAAIKEGIDMPGFVSRKYLPKFDWGIGNRGGRIISEEEEPWVMAPATSHIHSFRYLDSRRLSKLQEDQERDRLLQLDERERAKQLAERERERSATGAPNSTSASRTRTTTASPPGSCRAPTSTSSATPPRARGSSSGSSGRPIPSAACSIPM